MRTAAVREGDDYVINGQKLWTSTAHHADWCFCLVRTDPKAKKQEGITYVLIDMKTPGITVRPIITLDGHHETNEVFFDNVRVPVTNRLGEENKGWNYAKYLLGHERSGIARVGVSKFRVQRAKELAAHVDANGGPLSDDPQFRQKVAALEVELKALEITQMRLIAEITRKQIGQSRSQGIDSENERLGAAAARNRTVDGRGRLQRHGVRRGVRARHARKQLQTMTGH